MTRHNLLNFLEVKQIVPRSQAWSYGSSISQSVANSYSWHKARHKGNKWQIRGNIKPPRGRSWFKSWQLGFSDVVPSCAVRISTDRDVFETKALHSCMLLQKFFSSLRASGCYSTAEKVTPVGRTYRKYLSLFCMCSSWVRA